MQKYQLVRNFFTCDWGFWHTPLVHFKSLAQRCKPWLIPSLETLIIWVTHHFSFISSLAAVTLWKIQKNSYYHGFPYHYLSWVLHHWSNLHVLRAFCCCPLRQLQLPRFPTAGTVLVRSSLFMTKGVNCDSMILFLMSIFFSPFNDITVSWGEVLKSLFCAFLISLVLFCSLSLINDSHRLLPLTSFFTILHVLWCMQMCVIKPHQCQHCSTAVYFPKITHLAGSLFTPFRDGVLRLYLIDALLHVGCHLCS